MSRIGKLPINIPDGVEVKVDKGFIFVKGPKGELKREINLDMNVTVEEGQIIVKRPTDNKPHKAAHGLTRALINNMVVGVTEGFQKRLEIYGVGYRAQLQGEKLILNVGYSHPVEIISPQDINIEVPKANQIVVSGIDKERVGHFAAKIRSVREPEPYKGKGVRYANEEIRRKVGKAGVTTG